MSNRPKVCLTFDFDAMSVWSGTVGIETPTAMSRGEFGARFGVPRILDLLQGHDLPATFFIPGHTVDTYPELCKEIADVGHEIAHHGYAHENPAGQTLEEERYALERGFEAIDKALGQRPNGYRSPAWDLSPNTVDLLLEFGIGYDSSLMASDFELYRLRQGDSMHTDRAFEFGEDVDIVEFPVSWTLDDWPQMEFNAAPHMVGLAAHSATSEMWRNDFDFFRTRVPDGAFGITFHPQVIGRGARLLILESLIEHMFAHDAEFLTVEDVVREWRTRHPW